MYCVNESPRKDRSSTVSVCMPFHNSVGVNNITKLVPASQKSDSNTVRHPGNQPVIVNSQTDRQARPIIIHPHIKLSMSDLISWSTHFSDGFDQLEPTHSIKCELTLMA